MKRKKNWWNCIFHSKEVQAEEKLKMRLLKIIELAPEFISRIGDVMYKEGDVNSTKVTGVKSLMGLLTLHKELWIAGFQNANLGPDRYGMFRAEYIPSMQPEEVFLGDIWGLFTKDIPFWDKYQNEGKTSGGYPIYEYLTVYQIILGQYKSLLSTNVKAIAKNAEEKLQELKNLGY